MTEVPEAVVAGHLELRFLTPEDGPGVLCQFVNVKTGEIREQLLPDPAVWAHTWRATAERKLRKLHEDEITPLVVIPSAYNALRRNGMYGVPTIEVGDAIIPVSPWRHPRYDRGRLGDLVVLELRPGGAATVQCTYEVDLKHFRPKGKP